ncbi:response regulator [Altericista sp. CCNU0014]|uniref:hybrid sensor histidine kinase/response regulator n=1 Tax=Altericista sp. CCNU0014 TaxID=3082949 RepID=UPI00384D58E8
MQPEQQRILGYFIEEAKEHLATIEHGLLNLQTVVDDTEMMNEVFRAAHSVKGGAAMLGIHSMQHISHRLEDYFKILKEHPVRVDAKIESLFLKVFDGLNVLTEELQSSLSLSEELSHQTLQSVEPVFDELQAHLAQLTGAEFESDENLAAAGIAAAPTMSQEQTMVAFESEVMVQLRQMLQLFQSNDTVSARQGLQAICATLSQLGAQAGLTTWQNLVVTVSDAIAESKNALDTLAAVTLPALKDARNAVLDGQASKIKPSETLLALVPVASAPEAIDWFSVFSTPATTATTAAESVESFLDDLLQEPETAPVEVAPQTVRMPVDFAKLADLLAEEPDFVLDAASEELEESKVSLDTEFSDLERLLDDPQRSTAGSGATAGGRSATTLRSNRRPGAAQTMKVGVKQLDNLSNLIGELVINRNTLEDNQDRLHQFLDNLLFQVQQLGELGQQMQDLYERSLLEGSLLASQRARASSSGSNSGTFFGQGMAEQSPAHASGFSFDALEMDNFTGFHSLSQEIIERIVRVREAASDIEFVVDSNEQVTRTFRQVTTQVQEGLTTSRMVPFSQMAERLPRAIRDVSLKCGKQARLELEGRDTLIDKGILERIYDPLTHLVNNAIYHGLETPEVRQRLGKNPEGVIKIRVFYQGNQTIISIADDGGGIDVERVKAKAISKGLATPEEVAGMSKQEIYSFLFQSGFSTNDQADQLAGRGVGMDVVRSSITDLRGVINTDSTPNKGTTFTIRLPLTLSITKALCCLHQNYSIAFPIDGVEDVLDLATEQLIQGEDGESSFIVWRDRRLPCKPLAQLLTYNRTLKRSGRYSNPDSAGKVAVVILRSGDDFIGLQVDEVMGEQEIVIKQLSGPVPKPLGISGVTVQGDGRVMAIADVLELVDLSLDRVERNHQFWQGMADTSVIEVETDPMVLIVDDSITVRELLSMTFSKAGYRVEQARDGLEAWEKLRSGLPCDLIFCDVEMPRMDGLELLSRLQQDEDLQDLPIAMLTSRGASKHKKMAVDLGAKGYFTKPYLEEVLLDAAQRMINGEVLIK